MSGNSDLATMFNEMADILDIQGANTFRIRAYRNAARSIEAFGEHVADLVARNPAELERIPGIGKGLHEKIVEYCTTGTIREHDEIKHAIPAGLLDMLRLSSFGPKRVKLVYDSLGIDSVDALEAACAQGKIRTLPGMGEKSEAKVLKGIRDYRTLHTARMPFAAAEQILEPYLAHLRNVPGIDRLEPSGSYRRCRETIGDLDILVTVQGDVQPVIKAFVEYADVADVLAHGDTKASVVLKSHVQTDLRVVEPACFGAALQYFTGSKEHNVALRSLAKDKGLKLSEYGVFRGETSIAGLTEEEVYAALGLAWIPPELRENRGEIEAAAQGTLPDLVALQHIRGDLHVHTNWSDGVHSVADMVHAAKQRGYHYLAITDHSQSVTVAHGLSPARLREQFDEIERVRAANPGFHVLAGSEVNILEDGSLDYNDDMLDRLDFVIAAVHTYLDQAEAVMTKRIVRALAHPRVRCLAHPTTRLIGERMPSNVDMAAVIAAAKEHRVALEINAAPDRLDLNDAHADQARAAGVPLSIGTDSHSASSLAAMRFGLNVARRAWCTPRDVLNAWPWQDLQKWLTRS